MSAFPGNISPIEAKKLVQNWRTARALPETVNRFLADGAFVTENDFEREYFNDSEFLHAYFGLREEEQKLVVLLIPSEEDRKLREDEGYEAYVYLAEYFSIPFAETQPVALIKESLLKKETQKLEGVVKALAGKVEVPLNLELSDKMELSWAENYPQWFNSRLHSVDGPPLLSVAPLGDLVDGLPKHGDPDSVAIRTGLRQVADEALQLSLIFFKKGVTGLNLLPQDFTSPVPPLGQGSGNSFGLL